ncbi:MAG: transaldolase [Thermoleophilia bacterium]|nr:transaldolase [Thermoleophilia bacterium]
MSNRSPLHALGTVGQSVWLDSITRDWLTSGELVDMVAELGITGVTSNPSIFAQALKSASYDEQISELADQSARDIFTALAVDDIRDACDVLRPIWKRTSGVDGMVSIEIEPDLAHDTEASVVRGRELWNAIGRGNLLIKVPATAEGLPVIERLIAEGINVNVTLLFSVAMYREVMQRYLAGLERRHSDGADLAVASVASFFVSRVDTAIDAQLPAGSELRGKAAVANALAAWDAYLEVFTGDRFLTLQKAGARPQRPLWASTGTKEAAYSDILYVQELIAAGSVNTMPLNTMRAFGDHGEARVTVTDAARFEARGVHGELREQGINLTAVTDRLLLDGVASFETSFEELLDGTEAKRAQLTK